MFADDRKDERIREALRDADKKGRLAVVAAVTGFQGGEKALRRLMKSDEPLSLMDRTMLGVHLA